MSKATRAYKYKVTADAAQVGSDQATVVLWFNLAHAPQALWDHVESDGADLLVYSQDENTRFATYPVFIDVATKRGLLAAKGTNLDSTHDTVYTIFLGDATATLPAVTDTYGRNAVFDWKFEAVIDLINNASTQTDLTGNGYTGTGSGLSVVNRGWFGKSLYNPSSTNQEGVSLANTGSGSAFSGMAQAGFSWVEVKENTNTQNESPWGYDGNNECKLNSNNYIGRVAAANRAQIGALDNAFAHYGYNYHDANDQSQMFRNGASGTLDTSTTEAWYTGVGLLNVMRGRASGGNWESLLGTMSIFLASTSTRSADEYAIEYAMMWDGGGQAGSGSGYVAGSGETGTQFWEWSFLMENCEERCSTDFSEYAVASGIPREWRNIFQSSNVAFEIVTDAGSPGGQALEIDKSGAGRPLITWDVGDGHNQSVLVCLESDNASAAPSVWINASGGDGDYFGYLMELAFASNNIGLWEGTGGGAFTNHDNGGFTLNANTKYWARLCRFSNGNIKGRVWADGTNEPNSWNVEATDNSQTSGHAGISELATGTFTTKVHYVSIGKGDNYAQGCEILHENWPTGECLYLTCSVDESLRVLELDGAGRHFVINVFGAQHDPQEVTWHRNKGQPYVTCSNASARGSILRFDKFGLAEEVLVAARADTFSVTFNYSASEMYYCLRQGVNGDLYKNSDDGGSESHIISGGLNWPGHIFFNPDDSEIYIPLDFDVRSYNSSGTLQTDFPNFSSGQGAHGCVVDGTNVMAGYWNFAALWYCPTTPGSWTNADTTARIWQQDLNEARDTIYGAAYFDDTIYKWDNLPPPASANRTTVASGTGYDTVHSVTWVNFAAAGSGSGFIGSGSGAVGSGSGFIPGSGSGAVGSGSGAIIEECYDTIARDTTFNRAIIWQERSGAVVDIMGWEALANATPQDRSIYYKGSAATRLSGSNSLGFRVIKSDLLRHLAKMRDLGCDVRAAIFGFVRHDMWLSNSRLQLTQGWNPGGRMAGQALEIHQARASAAISQVTNILEFAPWYNTVATESQAATPGTGSGSGFASGTGATYVLLDRKNTGFNGPLWAVDSGDAVDSLGSFTGSQAVLEFVFPAGSMQLRLEGNWAGTITQEDWQGLELDASTKTYGQELDVTLDALLWNLRITVTQADEMPRAVVVKAGQSQGTREGVCLDCSDPDAVAGQAPPWVLVGDPIFFVDSDNNHFKTIDSTFTVETDTGLDLTSQGIIWIARHYRSGRIYGLSSGGKVWSWNPDGTDLTEVFDTGFTDLETIHINQVTEEIVVSNHTAALFNQRIYFYSLTGTSLANCESRWGTNSIGDPHAGYGEIGGDEYSYVWDGLTLYRIKRDDCAADKMQASSGLSTRAGAINFADNTAFYIIGSAIYQFNPVTVNNPSNATSVAGNALLGSAGCCDFFENESGVLVWVWGGPSGKIQKWEQNSANMDQNVSTSNIICLCCRRPSINH